MAYEKNPDEIGIAWNKKSKAGREYISGILELTETGKINIVIFKNKKEAGSKAPDYIILKSKPSEKGVQEEQNPF